MIAGLSLTIALSVAGAELPSTNEEFVSLSIARAVRDFVDSLSLSESGVWLEPAQGLNQLAADGVRMALLGAGWRIENTPGQATDFVVATNLSAFDFRYVKGQSRGFLNKPFIRRTLSGQVAVNFSGGDFSYFGFLDFADADSILPEHENFVASPRYRELAPEALVGGLERYLEPLAVVGTVGGLVYLFFVNR